jgi:hypothetical protein
MLYLHHTNKAIFICVVFLPLKNILESSRMLKSNSVYMAMVSKVSIIPNKKVILISVSILAPLFLLQSQIGNPLPILVGRKIWIRGGMSDAQVLQEFIRHAPVGKSIESVKQGFEINGFKCQYSKNTDARGHRDMNRSAADGDYLYCSQMRSSQFICTHAYYVTINYTMGKVSKVEASTGDWCL